MRTITKLLKGLPDGFVYQVIGEDDEKDTYSFQGKALLVCIRKSLNYRILGYKDVPLYSEDPDKKNPTSPIITDVSSSSGKGC